MWVQVLGEGLVRSPRLSSVSSLASFCMCARGEPENKAMAIEQCSWCTVHAIYSVTFELHTGPISLRARAPARGMAMLYSFLRRGLAGQAAASGSSSVKLHRALLLLGVSQHAEPQQVREAYIRLAKVYHPDSGSPHASNHKFIQVRTYTYRNCYVNVHSLWYIQDSERRDLLSTCMYMYL